MRQCNWLNYLVIFCGYVKYNIANELCLGGHLPAHPRQPEVASGKPDEQRWKSVALAFRRHASTAFIAISIYLLSWASGGSLLASPRLVLIALGPLCLDGVERNGR